MLGTRAMLADFSINMIDVQLSREESLKVTIPFSTSWFFWHLKPINKAKGLSEFKPFPKWNYYIPSQIFHKAPNFKKRSLLNDVNKEGADTG